MKKELVYQDIIQSMTTGEKISLLSGRDIWSTKPLKRLNIPAIYLSDGPHGIRKQIGASDHLGLNASQPSTCFPTASTVANSWNEELAEKIGEMLGEEAGSQNVNVLLGPGLNMKRSPLCGRNFEYFSEDPYLSGKMAAAYIRGIQKKGIAACPKHFAVNNRETMRMEDNSIVDERTLRELYLTGFEIAVKEGKPKAIMTSYNRINGVYANENAHLLQDILREEWGFNGAVITDWGGSNDHTKGVEAGSTLEMPGTAGDSDRQLQQALKEGRIREEIIDERVDEILRLISSTRIKEKKSMDTYIEAHHAAAEKAAEESLVLLKNNDDILPLREGTAVAVIGEFADVPRYQGAGSSIVNPTKTDSALDLIKEFPLQVKGYERGYKRNKKTDEGLIKKAVKLASNVQAVLLYMGLDEASESEGLDRTHLRIPESQIKLLKAVSEVNKNIIVILSSGSVVEMPWIEKCKALLYAGLGGQAGAGAVLKAITGQINPSGKLSETYPLSYKDTPVCRYWKKDSYESEYREGLYIGYRYYETANVAVQFPFGFGLSYTQFTYQNLTVSEKGVSFTLKNTGTRDGAEIAQMYISKPEGMCYRPVKELKGFQKVFLKAGEEKQVQIPFDDKTFRYYDAERKQWQQEKGIYHIRIGASVADIRLENDYILQVKKQEDAESPNDVGRSHRILSYYSGKVTQVSEKEFEELLGYSVHRKNFEPGMQLEMNDAICKMCYAKSMAARFVFTILKYKKERSEKRDIPDLNIQFIYNMPFRGIAKMMNGLISMEMAEAILLIVNGHFQKGMGSLIRGYFKNHKNRKNYIFINYKRRDKMC
ncbi:MAG: glycosyl hydrolase [Lachnospiraceae bacterium]|nr:glycosyl hydrolase [Lachnospiraceae bacterium]